MLPVREGAGVQAPRLWDILRENPSMLPALGMLALCVVWAGSQAGYPLTHWAPGGLIAIVLVLIALAAAPRPLPELPPAVRLAIGCLAAYTAWSFLSIIWASVPGEAWEGADRTLLYLLVFVLFAGWAKSGQGALLLLCVWLLAMIGLALSVAVHLRGASEAELRALMPEGRLAYPVGYPNAAAALWSIAFWPAALLARGRVPSLLRAVFGGGAVLLAELALLSQSRGWLYSTPLLLVLVLALLPGRVRTFLALAAIAVAVSVEAPTILHALRSLERSQQGLAQMHHALAGALVAALVVAIVFAAAGLVESWIAGRISPRVGARVHRAAGIIVAVLLIGLLAGGLVALGNPVTKAREAWHSFTHGYSANSHGSTRLVSGLGSNRNDFYRVALDEFAAHPLLGLGADNFAQQYLARRRSDETPHYPHSVELRTLSQTGIVGMLLAVVGLGAALVAIARVIRRGTEPAALAAAAAVAGFAYWLIHGSFDWFWEFAGLGAPAFALLGLACCAVRTEAVPAVSAPRLTGAEPASPGQSYAELGRPGVAQSQRLSVDRSSPLVGRPRGGVFSARRVRAVDVTLALVAIGAGAALLAPWLSERQIERAASVWTRAPEAAYAHLESAAELNPLSEEAYVIAGEVAVRRGESGRARREFARALARNPGDPYATLQLGAVLSEAGHRREALRLLRRAARLDPREPLVRQALAIAQQGSRVDVRSLNRAILQRARALE